jgi:hypothetical protein
LKLYSSPLPFGKTILLLINHLLFLFSGVDDEAVSLMVGAVEQFLRNLISSVLMDRSGYRLRDNKVPFAVGNDCPNPWLLNTQRRARTNPQVTIDYNLL